MFTTVAVIVYGKDQQPAAHPCRSEYLFIAPFDINHLFIATCLLRHFCVDLTVKRSDTD